VWILYNSFFDLFPLVNVDQMSCEYSLVHYHTWLSVNVIEKYTKAVLIPSITSQVIRILLQPTHSSQCRLFSSSTLNCTQCLHLGTECQSIYFNRRTCSPLHCLFHSRSYTATWWVTPHASSFTIIITADCTYVLILCFLFRQLKACGGPVGGPKLKDTIHLSKGSSRTNSCACWVLHHQA